MLEIERAIGAEIRRIRLDAGVSQAALAREAGIGGGHLCDIERGRGEWGIETLARIAFALGADLSVRLYPNSGPRLRDRWQVRMLDALLRAVHPRWRRYVEVATRKPVRGVVDAVLHDPLESRVVAVEVESDLRRLEQEIRWAAEKADALPSSTLWPAVEAASAQVPRIGRLMVLRSTRATREVAHALGPIFDAAWPAQSSAVLAALSGTAAWPGNGLLWMRVDGSGAQLIDPPSDRRRRSVPE